MGEGWEVILEMQNVKVYLKFGQRSLRIKEFRAGTDVTLELIVFQLQVRQS